MINTQYPLTGNAGIIQLVQGRAQVDYESLTEASVIIITGYAGAGFLTVDVRLCGNYFQILSSNPNDNSKVAYLIIGGL